MNTEIISLVGSAIAALLSFFTVIYTTRSKKPQQEASTTDSIADAATKVVDLQAGQIEKMEEKIKIIEKEMRLLRNYVRIFRAGVKKLVNQVEEQGLEPEWHPDELPPIEDKED